MKYNPEWLHQTDSRLPRKFQRFGCFVRAIIQGAEDYFGEALSVSAMNRLIDRAKTEKAINAKMFLQNADSHVHLLNIAIDELGYWKQGYRGLYFGRKDGDYVLDEEDVSFKFYIDEYDVTNAAQHFVRADEDGTIIWNPMPDLKLGARKSRRAFAIRRS